MILVLVAGLLVASPEPSLAHVWNSAQFPNNGMLYMSRLKNFSGIVYVEHGPPSVGCGTWEQDRAQEVWNNIHSTTHGQSSFSKWTTGIHMVNSGCQGLLSTDGTYFTYSAMTKDTGIAWDQNQQHFLQGDGSYIGGRIDDKRHPPLSAPRGA